MELDKMRTEINDIDDKILQLFINRMDIASDIAKEKQENNIPIVNVGREREILNRIAEQTPEQYEIYSRVLFSTMFELSKSRQNGLLADSPLKDLIKSALEQSGEFPKRAMIACQGVEGAYSQLATDKLFSLANILYFRHFEGVFSAVEKGLCKYGVLPIENSSYGSVNEVYDLMKNHKFYIVRTIKLHIGHSLLAKKGVTVSEINEIFSHEQAIGQCSEFLRANPKIKVTICENTAIAAKRVSESDRTDVAAISSSNCAELYGLDILDTKIQNSDNNYTRFICISKDAKIYEGADKISFMLNLQHKPGALFSVLSKFNSLGVNLSKLESRPIVGTDFEFMFYFDLDASVKDEKVVNLLCELDSAPEPFTFFGAYSEK